VAGGKPTLYEPVMPKISKFDAADYLKTPEQIAAYLAEARERGTARFCELRSRRLRAGNGRRLEDLR
jgi:DNA-binding phage protein